MRQKSMATEGDQAIEKARVFFEGGADVIYLAVVDDRILVELEPPDRPGVIVSARSIHEVRRFVRDVKRDR